MLEILLIIIGILILIMFVNLGWGISTYNTFVAMRQDIGTQWSNIRTEYQRRMDLFYNLVMSVKSYKIHEKETLTKVVEMRSQGFKGGKVTEAKKMKEMDNFFSKLLAVVEQYPNLKSNEQHNKLMDEIRVTEDRINVSRTDYNTVVRDYNVKLKTFPSNIIGRMFNFRVELFFESEKDVEKAPKIDL